MNTGQNVQTKPINRFVLLVSCAVAVGGLLFGYDTAVISGAVGFLQERFHLDATMTGWVTSCILIGCMIGAAIAGVLSDHFGRKKILILSAILFIISSLGSALANTVTVLVVWRIIGGIGVGITALLSPLYIAEIAPAHVRGRLVSLNQLAIVIGIFVVYFVNAAIANNGEIAWNVEIGWRWMLAMGVIPSVLFFVLLLFIAESPRWLEQKGRRDEALRVLKRMNNDESDAKEQLAEIQATIKSEGMGSIKQLFKPGFRMALFIGSVLVLLQQFSGINAIMYYAPEIFKSAGAGEGTAFIQTVLIGATNLLFTLVAIWLIDKLGRKVLLAAGSASMSISLIAIATAFHFGYTDGVWILVFILLAIASFAVSLAPVTWVIISEIFPNRIRGRAMSIVTVLLWGGDYIVSQTFPMLTSNFGPAVTFGIYGCMTAIAFLFAWLIIPETHNRTLEDIEESWVKRGEGKKIS
ncbi:sugar porter family MFS transporter [Priestia megaterium]|nr:sugar porter family MFS transporter [Priestia megaterium]